MKLILLSGGAGKRLWPLSNEVKPKQFIEILEHDSGEYESMFQRFVKQLSKSSLINHTFIATTQNHIKLVQSQLKDAIPIILEPSCRDTFPAISLSAIFLYDEYKLDLEEVICICPVDLYVDDSFFETIKTAEQILLDHPYDMALIGISPSYPAEKYGYILSEGLPGPFGKVKSFVEKPKRELATSLISREALWNSGVFCFKLKYLIQLLKDRNITLSYTDLLTNYESLAKNSFDYEVVERVKSAIVVPYKGNWNDMGTWDTLTEKMNQSIVGKSLLSNDSINTHVINKLDIPVLGLGLTNLVVVATENGILVSDKSNSVDIKNYM